MKWLKVIILFVLIHLILPINSSFSYEIPLEGQWKILFTTEKDDYSSPTYNDDHWPIITLPNKNIMPHCMPQIDNAPQTKSTKITNGYYWLRKHFYIYSLPNTPVAILIREIMNADVIYVNGKNIGSSGRFPPDFKSAWANTRVYLIPQNVLVKGDNVIAIKVYYNAESWIMGPVKIIDAANAKKIKLLYDFFLIDIVESFSVLLLALGIFFILFYIKRSSEIEYLYFACSSICIAIALTLHYIENRYPDLPIDSNTVLIVSQTGLLFFPSFLSLFLRQYTIAHITIKRLIFTLFIPAIGTFLMLINYYDRYSIITFRNIFIAIISLFIIDAIINSFIAVRRGEKKGLVLFYGMIPTFLFGLHDILAFGFNVLKDSIPLYIYGIPFLLFVISGVLVNRFVSSLNEAEQLNTTLRNMMDSFARFVPVEFLRYLNKNNITEVMLGDAIINNMTILFMDIRNFTGLTEKMNPDEVFKFLNSFLKNMEPHIAQHHGFIDKYIGDAIMALFSESASSAIRSAISMREHLKEYNNYREKNNYQPIDFGIGINSGEVILGTVGSTNRMETTVIGNAVNLAARMEELTKVYKVPIIISEITYSKIIDPAEFYIRKIDVVKIRGRSEPLSVYEVFNTDDHEIKVKKLELLELFYTAFDYYKNSDFKQALKLYSKYYKQLPNDTVVKLFIRRCQYFITNPPDKLWNGIAISR